MRKQLLPAVIAALAVVGLANAAQAHAFLDRAEPRVGSTVAAAPTVIRLRFTEALEAALSSVTVEGPAGFGGAERAAPSPDPRELDVALRQPVPAGRYTVRWRVMSVDSHMTEGDFTFQVRP
jgi:methionine-rich copper-binding protein CopC